MANLKEIRTRISSVSSTKQITSAMKMVSAAKLRKAQDAIIQLRPYANKLQEILSHLSENLDTSQDNKFAQKRSAKKILVVAISSNRGLCGAFNSNVVKRTIALFDEDFRIQHNQGNVDIMVIGKKAGDVLKSRKYRISQAHHELFDNLTFDAVKPIAEKVMQSFLNKEYDQVFLVYNQFKNAGSQNLTCEQFLPIKPSEKKEKKSFKADYIFEPNKEEIVQELIPKSLKIQFYKALLDSNAAEHGARMTAMHKATDNATELIRTLKLKYNKARQASITNEILEIVGGANALKG